MHGVALEEKDAVTGVQTLRNALMVVALTSQAAAYIGARALPDLLFNPDYQERLHQLPVRADQRSLHMSKHPSMQAPQKLWLTGLLHGVDDGSNHRGAWRARQAQIPSRESNTLIMPILPDASSKPMQV